MFTTLLPVALMLLATGVDLFAHRQATGVRAMVDFVGDPVPAMLIAAVFSFYSLGAARGFSAADVLRFSEECLAPLASIMLIIGAGGGFGGVLTTSGVGAAVAQAASTRTCRRCSRLAHRRAHSLSHWIRHGRHHHGRRIRRADACDDARDERGVDGARDGRRLGHLLARQ